MLYVEMDGRCGNQLFHYAVARYIQLTIGNKEKLCLNFNKIFEKKDYNAFEKRETKEKLEQDAILKQFHTVIILNRELS